MTSAARIAIGLAGSAIVLALVVAFGVRAVLTTKPSEHVPAPERCATCHSEVLGIEPSHAPGVVACAACHLGDGTAADEAGAHAGLVRIPGNLSDAPRTCGSAQCHPQMVARVNDSLMATMAGVVAVDRWVFGEQAIPSGSVGIREIGHSPADTHLRNLCASCHLGADKTEAGPLDETSRGGGCNACHLAYSPEASLSLRRDRAGGFARLTHPTLKADVDDARCFGCHARSGRISLNYRGWREGHDRVPEASTRALADGRTVYRAPADVHAEAGLGCTDCHTSYELMGDGTRPQHADEKALVTCDDCHREGPLPTLAGDALDPDASRLAALRGHARDRTYVKTSGGHALVNTEVKDSKAVLVTKQSGRTLPLRPPGEACRRGAAHDALSCGACHDAWAPTCLGCHTRFDAEGAGYDLLTNGELKGEWHESAGAMLAEPASLGVREGRARHIEEFVPGMVLTIARGGSAPFFKRLFAPVVPHTVRRESRSCEACHADPVALGYGRGLLAFEQRRWRFTPSRALEEDGLPEDAWVGFLAQRGPESTTRENTRPFSIAEQRRILDVGACLGCHARGAELLPDALDDFERVLRRRTARCVTPRWD